MTDGLKDEHRQAIIAAIAANDRVERAVLFGSRATGTNTVSSDVDIALFGDRLTLTDQARLASELDELPMAQSVDLVLHHSIQDRTLLEHIWHQGVDWYARPRKRASKLATLPVGTTHPRGLPPVDLIHWPLVPARELFKLTYGRGLAGRARRPGNVPVYGTNGRCGSHDAALFEGPGVILGRKGQGPLGVEWSDGPYWVIDTAYTLTPLRQSVDLRFAYYLLKFIGLNHLKDGTSNPTLSRETFGAQALPLPPIRSQRAIAQILGTLDDKIELNRRMNATLESMADALFRSWFVDFDPVRARMEGRDTGLPKEVADLFPDRLVESALGEIPEGWQLESLDAVARFQNELALQKFRPSQNEARLPVVKIAQLRAGESNSGEWASASIKPACIIKDGDVVFSWSGSLLVRTWCGGRAALNQHLFKVTSERYPKWFYLHCILSHFPEFQRIAADKATTMGHIKRHHLTDAMCIVPPDHLIARLSGLLGDLLERGVANEVASRTLVSLRDALLAKLVSGELRTGRHGARKDATA